MNVYWNANSGCERFLCLHVIESKIRLSFDSNVLDSAGRSVLRRHANYAAFAARLTVAWRSDQDREQCKKDQAERRRWATVQEFAQSMKNGSVFPAPVFLSPKLAMSPEHGVTFLRRLVAGNRTKDDSQHAMRVLPGKNGSIFQQRGSDGVDPAKGSAVAETLPHWVKLVRQGNVFTAYDSADGVTWNWLGTETILLPASSYVGLAVSSHDVTKLCNATFDQVSVTQPPLATPAANKSGTGDGLQATYYDQIDQTGNTITRVDPMIDFDWSNSGPAPGMSQSLGASVTSSS